MKAVVYDRYGSPDVLHLEDVSRPVPRVDEVQVRVHATAVTRADCATREANRRSGTLVEGISHLLFGIRGPRRRILGNQFAGTVEAVGSAVNEFAAGDAVFGSTGFRFGAWAEFVTVRAGAHIAHKPARAGFEEAAAICDGGFYALWCLQQGKVRGGQQVLVYGASGAIGTAGVQLAKSFGAHVTAVTSLKNLELVKSLGADRLIDYTREDFLTNGETYDVIFDAVGKQSFARCKGSLKRGGRFLATDGLANYVAGLTTLVVGDKKVKLSIQTRTPREDIGFLSELVETGRFRPVIDRRYPLAGVVEASRYVDTERKVGNVILTVTSS